MRDGAMRDAAGHHDSLSLAKPHGVVFELEHETSTTDEEELVLSVVLV